MNKIFLALLLFMNMNARAQSPSYSVATDPDGGWKIYNGLITFSDLDKDATFTWLKKGRDKYKPDAAIVGSLTELKNYSMVVFLGTWCDDSHDLVPKLEKVLQTTGYPMDKLTMYGVDLSKKTTSGVEKKYGITLVPTIILFDSGGKEAGRITESVKKSIEGDLAAIIDNDLEPQPR